MLTTILVIGAIAFCFVALLAEDFPRLFQKRGDNSSYRNVNNRISLTKQDYIDIKDVYCPECGSPNVTVYDDGSCVCDDCQFEFHIDILR